MASNLGLIGAVLTDQKKYEEARGYLDEAPSVQMKVFGPNHTRVARTVNQLARAQLAHGDLDAAEASFKREFETCYRTWRRSTSSASGTRRKR